MSQKGGRVLPNSRLRRLMLAIQEVMGPGGLAAVLRQADLPQYAGALPPNNNRAEIPATD